MSNNDSNSRGSEDHRLVLDANAPACEFFNALVTNMVETDKKQKLLRLFNGHNTLAVSIGLVRLEEGDTSAQAPAER